jgi:Ankyrin repeats (3 copies)
MLKVEVNDDFDQVMSPLVLSALVGKIEPIQYFLNNFPIEINQRSVGKGYTAVAVATQFGNLEALQALLEQGADPNIPLDCGKTPLAFAVGRLNEKRNLLENKIIGFKMASLLLDYGAKIDAIVSIKTGNTLLLEVLSEDKLDIPQKQRETNFEIIRFLLEHGAQASRTNFKNEDALTVIDKSPFNRLLKQILDETTKKYEHPNPMLKVNRRGSPILEANSISKVRELPKSPKKLRYFKLFTSKAFRLFHVV